MVKINVNMPNTTLPICKLGQKKITKNGVLNIKKSLTTNYKQVSQTSVPKNVLNSMHIGCGTILLQRFPCQTGVMVASNSVPRQTGEIAAPKWVRRALFFHMAPFALISLHHLISGYRLTWKLRMRVIGVGLM